MVVRRWPIHCTKIRITEKTEWKFHEISKIELTSIRMNLHEICDELVENDFKFIDVNCSKFYPNYNINNSIIK